MYFSIVFVAFEKMNCANVWRQLRMTSKDAQKRTMTRPVVEVYTKYKEKK